MEQEEGRESDWGYLCKMRKDLLKTLDKKISGKKCDSERREILRAGRASPTGKPQLPWRSECWYPTKGRKGEQVRKL